MTIWLNVFFTVLTFSVFSFFAFHLRKNWLRVGAIGKGTEEVRDDQWVFRLQNMLLGGLLQRKMFTEPVPALMHFAIFWGFVTVSLGTIETIIHGIYSPFDFSVLFGNQSTLYSLFSFSQDIGNFMVFAAICFAFARRLFFPPPRLQSLSKEAKNDAFIVLGFILGLVSTSLFYMGAHAHAQGVAFLNSQLMPFSKLFSGLLAVIFQLQTQEAWATSSQTFWWLHVFFLFGFMIFLPFSKHQHLIWVWPNMFFQSLKKSGRIRPMEFDEDAESFGVGDVQGFTWKQLLDSMTCVECGRCTSVCPASSTEKPLDPRKIMHHLKDAMNEHSLSAKKRR